MKTRYTGVIRSTLSREERNALKGNAYRNGMTLTGYVDSLCRRAIREEASHGVADSRIEQHQIQH